MFFLVCTSKRLWKRFEINVDVQKGALSFTINLINRLIVSSNSCFHPLLSYGNSPQWQPCAFWVYIVGSRCWQNQMCLECSWASLSFALYIVAKLLCFCLCLFDASVELHLMDENMFNDLLIRKWKWISHVIKAYTIHDLYVVEAFITSHLKT